MADARPNILVITCHDLGRWLSCFGHPTVVSPNVDRLAAQGAVFPHHFATAPHCSPARATLATGRFPNGHGVMGLTHDPFGWDLGPHEITIARILRRAGYRSDLFGLQHISPRVTRLGFDHVHPLGGPTALAQPVAAQVVEFLSTLATTPHPRYIEVNLEQVHRPFEQGDPLPFTAPVEVPPYLGSSREAREEMAGLHGAIRYADGAIGRIVDAFDGSRLATNAVVVFVADHGIAMPRAKCTLYDPGIEAAVVLRAGDQSLRGGRVHPGLCSGIDILPTLCELAGVVPPARVQGRSLLAMARGGPPRDAIFAEKTMHWYADPMRLIRTAEWAFIRNFEVCYEVEVPGDVQEGALFRANPSRYHNQPHPPRELYDLRADPWQLTNVAEQSRYRQIRQQLEERLLRWMRVTGDPLLLGPVVSPRFRSTQRFVTMPAMNRSGLH